ncbi:fatty acid synthase [Trichonephila clavipes]|nr:fatty acid synthase [Trichonephila clavipes]
MKIITVNNYEDFSSDFPVSQDILPPLTEKDFNLSGLDSKIENRLFQLLISHKSAFARSTVELSAAATEHHRISLEHDYPIKCPIYKIPFNLRNEFRRQITDLEKAGIISKSNSQYNTPALFVKQREKWRLVLDFRKLNEITLTQDFLIPTLDDILHEISGSNYFSALDMKSAFNQIPLHFADRHKTAFSTPDGDKYEFNRLCFGLKNSPKAFQSIAREVLGDLLHNGALVSIDDIILFTKTIDEHFELLGNMSAYKWIPGFEITGHLDSGCRIMGISQSPGVATTAIVDPSLMWDVPDDWTLEKASTVPVAYVTAYYALVLRGRIQRGERVLIHSGSGGVGQAAIAVALHYGCEVFTSVGTKEKREFLKKRFPSLEDRHFCNSRDLSFEKHILKETNGEGVEVILNSLAEEKLKASLNCVAQNGRFLEIGKYDLLKDAAIGMDLFSKNISFHGILVDALLDNSHYSLRAKKELVQLLYDGIANGCVRPLNSIVFDYKEVENAFRYMASGKHIGKVVIKSKRWSHTNEFEHALFIYSKEYYNGMRHLWTVRGNNDSAG